MAVHIKPSQKANEFDAHLGGEGVSAPTHKTKIAKKFMLLPAMGSVSATSNEGKTLIDEKHTVNKGVMGDPSQLCQIHSGGSHTINLGNYESAKISVGITVPCNKDEINETYDFATDWVSQKLAEAIKIVKGEG